MIYDFVGSGTPCTKKNNRLGLVDGTVVMAEKSVATANLVISLSKPRKAKWHMVPFSLGRPHRTIEFQRWRGSVKE